MGVALFLVWLVSFVLGAHILVGWSRLFLFIRGVTGNRDVVLGQSLVLLWVGLVSSFLVPCWAFVGSVGWGVLGVGVVLLVFVVVAWVKWLRMDKRKYIMRVVLGGDFVVDIDSFEPEDLLALSRRQRMGVMFDDFMRLQRKRYNLESDDVR